MNRADVSSNIIVSKNKAHPARSLDELRTVLGVRASDNLRHAALVIVVEGTDDAISLAAIFAARSKKLRAAISSGSVAFDPIGGASKLRHALSQLQATLCNYYVVLDDDGDASRGFEEATAEGLASQANTSFLKCLGLSEAELEDTVCRGTLRPALQSQILGGRHRCSIQIEEEMERENPRGL